MVECPRRDDFFFSRFGSDTSNVGIFQVDNEKVPHGCVNDHEVSFECGSGFKWKSLCCSRPQVGHCFEGPHGKSIDEKTFFAFRTW